MEISKFLAVAVAVIVLYSVEATAQGEDIQSCIQKLMPCEKYLHTVSPHPPASCCGPLKEIMEKETVCLCTVFNNPGILKQINTTKEHALDLPKACGLNPDVSVCAKYASPTAAPGSTNGTSSASTISFNRFSFLSAFVALLFF